MESMRSFDGPLDTHDKKLAEREQKPVRVEISRVNRKLERIIAILETIPEFRTAREKYDEPYEM